MSATLRGFYDDNYATAPSNPLPGTAPAQSSYGFEVSPSFGLNLSQESSALAFKYTYGMRYYENRINSADHSHQADASVSHEFTPRAKFSATDSFVVAQEAALLDPGVAATALRSNGNNVHNTVSVLLENKLTRLLGTEVGYSNSFFDYEQTGPGSRSALLDRVEHLAHAHLLWYAVPTTTVIFGYQFGVVNQTSKDFLTATELPDTRDNRSHYGYLGADHYLTEQLSFHPRVGVQYTTYPNAPAGVDGNRVSPYADFKVSWAYAQNCDAQVGVKHSRTQTDVAGAAGSPTLDAETTAIYGAVNHHFTAKISGSLLGQYQRSEFNQGP
ncbi:MAG: hypothetical protein HYZ36_00355, partial [Pedosphaera parvula]|nr:hypothetical protein [Pedosphaera parvula]